MEVGLKSKDIIILQSVALKLFSWLQLLKFIYCRFGRV